MSAYYNEIDKNAAQHLRNLISAGVIAPGDVDERSIEDVRPDELMGYTQCHFFAGIGVWSYALRCAGWSDDRPVWTGSCPCQPFSSAGKGAGFVDERHLWPAWHHLISQCSPDTVFGEQVASKDGLAWLDLVYSDMEATGYAFAPVDQCAAGVGAPHIRQRLYFVGEKLEHTKGDGWHKRGTESGQRGIIGGRGPIIMGDTSFESREWKSGSIYRTETPINGERLKEHGIIPVGSEYAGAGLDFVGNTAAEGLPLRSGEEVYRESSRSIAERSGDVGVGQADANMQGPQGWECGRDGTGECFTGESCVEHQRLPGPTNGYWGNADWLFCRDGKWRPVSPSSFPLVDGSSFHLGSGGTYEGKSRSALLKGYGNAIVAPVAEAFIRSYMET